MGRLGAAFALALSCAACGDSGKDVSADLALLCDDPDGPWTAYQAKIAMCTPGVAGEDKRAWGRLPTHAETIAACRAGFEPYLKDGTIAPVDAARLDACRTWLQSTACNVFDPTEDNPCRTMLQGTVGGGSYCERDEQCAGDSICAGAREGSCGACKPRQAEGASCTSDALCKSGYCTGGMCAAPGAEMAACTSSYGCAGQLICVAGACAKPPTWAVDTACTPGDIYQCVSSTGLLECGSESKCVTVAETPVGTLAEGEACAESVECGPLLLCDREKCQYVAYTGKCPAY